MRREASNGLPLLEVLIQLVSFLLDPQFVFVIQGIHFFVRGQELLLDLLDFVFGIVNYPLRVMILLLQLFKVILASYLDQKTVEVLL
jgi:hypothetical protein